MENKEIIKIVECVEREPIGLLVVNQEVEEGIPLQEYKDKNPNYNLDGWVKWLNEEKGIDCELIEPDIILF